jgi:ABC-type multidrug transport system fused ATPase/permease subunit
MGKKKSATAVSKLEGRALLLVRVVLGAALGCDVVFSLVLLWAYRCELSLASLFSFASCAGTEVLISLLRCAVVVLVLALCDRNGRPPAFVIWADGDEGQQRDEAAVDDRSALWRRGSLVVVFAVLSASQIALGVKGTVSLLDPAVMSRGTAQAMFCLLIVLCNVELFVSKRLIETSTSEDGVFSRLSHGHRLFVKTDVGRSRCDRCHLRVVEKRNYNCASCNFDVCLGCLRSDLRKDQNEAENVEEEEGSEERVVSVRDFAREGLALVIPHLWLVVLALLCVLIRNIASIMVPSYTGQILDAVIRTNAADFKTALIWFISINLVLGLVSGASKLLFNAVFQRFDWSMKVVMFRRILRQDIEFFDSASTGDLLVKLQDDTRMMLSPIQYYLASVLGFVLSLIGGFVMCVRTSFRLSVLAFTILGPMSVVIFVYTSWATQLNASMRGLTSSMADTAKESFSLIRTIRAFGREHVQDERYTQIASEKLKMGLKDAFASAGTDAFTNYLELALQALVLAYGGSLILSGQSDDLTVGGLITFQLYWSMLSRAFQGLADQVSQFSKAAGAATRVIEILQTLPEVDPNAGIPINQPLGDIHLDDVWFGYKSRQRMVLKGVSLKIPRGSVCALVGRSGGGKSTLVSLLCGNYAPTRGSISVGGVDMAQLRLTDYRQRIGLVQQDTELFNESIERNIVFGVDSYTREELREAARKANCLDFIESFEDGFATKVGERGAKISGGQKQRCAIARVMLKNPDLLLLDEATSALDSESEAMVQASIDALVRGDNKPTVVLVAHRLSTVINADIIAVVEDGRICEQGTHVELLRQGGMYAKLVEKQVKKMSSTISESGPAPADTIDSLFDDVEGVAPSESRKTTAKAKKKK